MAIGNRTGSVERNASNFGKQALGAFHFAVIYGRAILQIRHLPGLCISNKTAIVVSTEKCRNVVSASVVSRGNHCRCWEGEGKNGAKCSKEDGRFEGANQSPILGFYSVFQIGQLLGTYGPRVPGNDS